MADRRSLQHEIHRLKLKLESDEQVRNASVIKLKLKVKALEDVNQDLELKFKRAKKENVELTTKSNIIKDSQTAQLDVLWKYRVDMDEKLRKMSADMTEQLERSEEMLNRTIAQQTLTHEADKLEMTADFNRREGEMEVSHQKQMEEVVSTLKDEIRQLEAKWHAAEVDHNNEQIELQQQKHKDEDNFNDERELFHDHYDELLEVCEELKNKNEIMCERTLELLKMDALKETNRDLMLNRKINEKTIGAQEKELRELKMSFEELQFILHEERNSHAVLKTKLDLDHNVEKALELKIKQLLLELKQAKEAKQETIALKDTLTRTVDNLENRLGCLARQIKELKEEHQILQNYQLQFREGLQDCFDEISNKKEFNKRILELKRRYVDNVKSADVVKASIQRHREEKKNESVFREKVSKTFTNMTNWRKGIKEQAANEVVRIQQRHSEYITVINEQTVQIKEQKRRERKWMQHQPRKGTIPIHVKRNGVSVP
ncbi:hypothetical protein VZT92_010154 [Zoarces viviparus]|uniref:Uncharacterized protein n=1 Tax=Zoarces viviparus TaxID=48416 RepID=A0AAW1FE48_ZOAVI